MDGRANWFQPNANGCWLWPGNVNGTGYGTLTIHGKQTGAHRLMWRLMRGPIPPGIWVLHHCDTRLCVNPDHLFLGTHADNMRDMVNKDRQRSGGQPRIVCKHGHLLDGPNLVVRGSRGERRCYHCEKASVQRYRKRLQAQRITQDLSK